MDSAVSIVPVDLPAVIRGFADRFHRQVAVTHHVASPLCAWLLLAICAGAARGRARDELSTLLGMDVGTAGHLAARLIEEPHDAVAPALAIWTQIETASDAFAGFLASLPPSVERGDRIPDAPTLDEWITRRSRGLISRFPAGDPQANLLMATVLATDVKWATPFRIAQGSELGRGDWGRSLQRVLRAKGSEFHACAIIRRGDVGDVAVHAAQATRDLAVVSVIAERGVPAADVLRAAHEIATTLPHGSGRVSLFDLPLGDGPCWSITEREIPSDIPGAREEGFTALLPAWTATNTHNLSNGALGFAEVAGAIADAAGLPLEGYGASQATTAHYSRLGFKAASATVMGVFLGRPSLPSATGLERHATLRFSHPYAVVAVTRDDGWNRWDRDLARTVNGPWHGIPVFSAWVAEPMDAEEDVEQEDPSELDDLFDDEEEIEPRSGS